MRNLPILAILLAFVTACGSKGRTAAAPGGAAVASVFPAARFVPAKATFVISAPTMRDAQNSLREVADVLGMAGGFEVSDVSQLMSYLIAVDALSAEAVSNIGIDLGGNIAVFSEDLNPTFVAHINSPEAIAAFFDKQRERGLKTTSVVVGDTEVFTADISARLHISWAVSGEWLWVHFTAGAPDGSAWFEHSKNPGGAGWVDGWTWAKGLASAPQLVGYFDPKRMLATAAQKAPSAMACIDQLSSIHRVGLTVETAGKQLGARLVLDLGAAGATIGANVLPPPPGWDAASANAPMSGQWNLDMRAGAAFAQACMRTEEIDSRGNDVSGPDLVAQLDQFGLRTARVFVHKIDVDDKEGVGALSADLSNANFLRAQLDQIPRRSMFESSRTFGKYKGKHISVPFVGAGDYVLDDSIVIAAMGDGVLAKIGAGTSQSAPPVFAADLRPQGLPVSVWAFLLEQANAPNPERFAQRLMTWNELHVGARLDGDKLVIDASGTRR